MSPDADDLLENDKQKIQNAWNNYQSAGSWRDSINPQQLLENICWILALCSVVSMVVMLPWVGNDALIPGTVWLGVPLTIAIVFGIGGFAIRLARTGFKDGDSKMSSKFERGR
jgi:hypothetical protein